MTREMGWKLICVNLMMWVALSCSAGGETSTPFSLGEVESVLGLVEQIEPESIRTVGHQAVDVYAAFLKMKVNVVATMWGSLSPEQRHIFVTGFVEVIKVGEQEVEKLLPMREEALP